VDEIIRGMDQRIKVEIELTSHLFPRLSNQFV